MTVSAIYLVLVIAIIFKNGTPSTNELLMSITVLLANGIISICSRLDDLKRK